MAAVDTACTFCDSADTSVLAAKNYGMIGFAWHAWEQIHFGLWQ